MKQASSRHLLIAIEEIYHKSEKSVSFSEAITVTSNDCKIIMDFFSCSQFEAFVLSYCIYSDINEKLVTNSKISTFLKSSLCEMAEIVQCLRKLVNRGFLKCIKDRQHGVKYNLSGDILLAAITGKQLVEKESNDETMTFLIAIRDLTNQRFQGEISNFELWIGLQEKISESENISFIKWLQSYQLEENDLLFLINACFEHIMESTEINADLMLKMIFDSNYEKFFYKKGMRNGSSKLFSKLLLDWENKEITNGEWVRLGDVTVAQLFESGIKRNEKPIASRYFTIHHPEKIKAELLYYNQKEEYAIAILKKALQQKEYKRLRKGLYDKNLPGSVSVIFHGSPGTGKTATVMQVARDTKRVLLFANASILKSMWLGESEKNIKRLFDEYKSIAATLKLTPILLFNEADAILGSRIKVSGSVDQTMNTIQNIILQELETFDGIFIATTNLVNNMDEAFERRFLYKVRFEKPTAEVQLKLLSEAFPQVSLTDLGHIISETPLTGSNINNIVRKITIESLIENTNISAGQISRMAKEEFINRHRKEAIGFNRTTLN